MVHDELPLFDWEEPRAPGAVASPRCSGGMGSAVVAGLVAERFPGIAGDEEALAKFLSPKVADMGHPFEMPGVREAAGKILDAVAAGGEIVVFGDFDADGVTATAILTDVIRRLGGRVRPFIPVRAEGYGLSEAAVTRCLSGGSPKLLVTVDCGMGAGVELRRFLAAGAEIVVSDHHLPGEPLPSECTVVSTHSEGVPEACRVLCGAGVAYKIACGATVLKYPAPSKVGRAELLGWLDALSVATVADVVPLVGENRLLVACGLARLNKAPRIGLKELILAAFSDLGSITTDQLGFILAPHINSAGRMKSAEVPLELLLARDADTARQCAVSLKQTNALRKSEDTRLCREAEALIAAGGVFDEKSDGAVVVAGENWPAGVIGLAASRLSEKYGRPAVVISLMPDGGARGSVRAPRGYNAHAALTECAGHLAGFGGHESAAGLSLAPEDVPAFRKAFCEACFKQVGAVRVRQGIEVEAWLGAGDIDTGLLADMHRLEPFGEGNPEPVFGVRDVAVRASAMGKAEKIHLRLHFERAGEFELDGVWFGAAGHLAEIESHSRWDVIGTLMEDTFTGELRVKLRVIDMRPAR